MFYNDLVNKAKRLIDTPLLNLTIEGAVTKEPVTFEDKDRLDYKSFRVGDSWGDLFDCAWFKITGKVSLDGDEPVYLKLDLNGEALLYDRKGKAVKGFTNGSSVFGFMGNLGSPVKRYYQIDEFIDKEGNIELWLDGGMNDLFGNVKKKGRIEVVQAVTRNLNARKLYYDLKVLSELARVSFKKDKEAHRKYVKGLNRIRLKSYGNKAKWLKEALAVTQELLKTPTKMKHEISSIGHAHLDLAWLWPIRETKRKGERTFSNALRLMEIYDDYHFGASQPQLYQWIKDQQPEMYEEIRQRIEEGRWEVQGGMWVEADTNISGEEALVRQMLYGTRFYKEEFGIAVNSLWLPDVFGYSGNMPQIIKKSGMDNFMTIKLSWNDTNKFPHHTFNWKGIDGSDVFAHMPPEGEYNSPANGRYLLKSVMNYRERAIDNRTLNLFGVGDGGGGPSASHVERIRRFSGTAPMPKVTMEPSWKFFKRLSKIKEQFPTFAGELYLEKHRGTYTSQGKVKYYNRKMEQKLKTIEAMIVQKGLGQTYKEALESIWKEVLLYQFHDILPGSSISRVYEECIERYQVLDRQTDVIIEAITEAKLTDQYDCPDEISVYNPLLTESIVSMEGKNSYHQLTVAPMSNVVTAVRSYKKTGIDAGEPSQLENDLIKVTFKKDGSISCILDKKTNMKILKNVGNQLRVYTDIANAWDIFRYYRALPSYKMKLTSTETIDYGEVGQVIQQYRFGKSTVRQKITLEPGSRFIKFELDVEWYSLRKMLRTAFPLNLKTDKAVFDIQFGHIERSTKNDSKVLKAQYEASGHNWVDMNNGDWGAALITDCKYGFKAKGSTLDLNLIKSTNYPAKNGDIGTHQIKYGLYIHEGDVQTGKVDEVAMAYNTYMPITESAYRLDQQPIVIDTDQITYSSIKYAETEDAVVYRLYEKNGKGCNATIRFLGDNGDVYETNMVEEERQFITDKDEVTLDFSPFEVKTIMVMKEK